MECYNYTIRKDVYTEVKKVNVCRQPDFSQDPCSDEEWIRNCIRRRLGVDYSGTENTDIYCSFAQQLCDRTE